MSPANRQSAVQDLYPLSPTQQGLLFHSLYGPESGVYIIQVSYTLTGNLNREAFAEAWQQLMARHSILRSAFVWDTLKTPIQAVGKQVSLPIQWLDWRDLDPQQQQKGLNTFLLSDRQQGFNVKSAPLMRLTEIRLSETCDRIIWTHHHLLLDGWSLPTLLKEWLVFYQQACDVAMPPLPPALPYRDYIAWLQKQDHDTAKSFWCQELAGIKAPTPLGIDHSNVNERVASQEVGTQRLNLSAELTQQLKTFAQTQRLTLSTLVQGAWGKLLSVYSGETSVLFGVVSAGRPPSLGGMERRVGLFINTLPLCLKVDPDKPVVAWLQDLQTRLLARQAHEHLPLVDIQRLSELPQTQPLFESVVVFENYPLAARQTIGGLALEEVAITEQTHYPLTLYAFVGESLELKALYDPQRFESKAIARLLGHFQVLLQDLATSESLTLKDLSILSAGEKKQLRSFGEGPLVEDPLICVQQLIAKQALKMPAGIAVRYQGQTLSYRDLEQKSNQLAHYLLSQGIQPGDNVGLCVLRSQMMVVSLLGILKAGCAYVPLDPSYPIARLTYTTQDAEVRYLICDEVAQSLAFTPDVQRLNLSEVAHVLADQPTTPPKYESSLDDRAYLIYTSGSTGQPKGVPITHRNLSNLLRAMQRRLNFQPGQTLLAVTTLAFDIAALELFVPLISGGEVILATDNRNAQQLMSQLSAQSVDFMQATPATWRLLMRSGWEGQQDLTVLCGGETLDGQLAEQLIRAVKTVWNVYGPTETTIWSGALPLTLELITGGTVPIGAPLDNTEFCVLDTQHQPVPVGVAGELHIGGEGLTPGYWQREDLTAERFIPNPLAPTKRLYKTGDRVRYREDGTLDYLGRLDQQTKLRGYRIELGEIEAAIAEQADVETAVVVVRGDTPETQRLVAYLTLKQGTAETLENSLRSQLSTRLPSYMRPSAYQVLEAFPLTPNGKIDRNALPEPQTQSVSVINRPQSSVERTLADIWRSLLQRDAISVHDNFFEAGGHSLLLVNAQSQIRERLEVDLSLMQLFQYPTLRTLATFISQHQGDTLEPAGHSYGRTEVLDAGKQRLQQRRQQRQNSKQGRGE
ncbi:MAG: amino acid adenylation domain-containing protein [Cyanobacteria bacterium P01_H01_bin.15]